MSHVGGPDLHLDGRSTAAVRGRAALAVDEGDVVGALVPPQHRCERNAVDLVPREVERELLERPRLFEGEVTPRPGRASHDEYGDGGKS